VKRILFLSMILSAVLVSAPATTANGPAPYAELAKLNISVGRWVFHGKSLKTASGKAGGWTWNEDCRWSPNHLYLECTFSNDWAGKKVESLVVDTYNTKDHSYWHYELYAAGSGGRSPFVSRMTISGNTWTEYGEDSEHGNRIRERIVYRWASPTRVSVTIESSKDGVHWVILDKGEGIKQE
jgi:hypothetical protein